jgi:hypothetical protein
MDPGEPAEEVEKLTGADTGQWQVTTEDERYTIDLDEWTVTKAPAAYRTPGVNERQLPLRALHICWVGDPGFWTMRPDWPRPTIEYYWYVTTVTTKISRLPPDPTAGPSTNGQETWTGSDNPEASSTF